MRSSVSQGRIFSDNFTRCHTEIEVVEQTFHLTQSQYTDTGPTSPSTYPITPGAWQGSHSSANFQVTNSTPEKSQTRDLPLSRRTPLPLGQRGGLKERQDGAHTDLSERYDAKSSGNRKVGQDIPRGSDVHKRQYPQPHKGRDGTERGTGAGIMAADDREVTTVFTVQPSFHHRHSTNRVSRSVTIVGECAVTPHLVVRRRW